MRKVENIYESPIDNALLDLCETVAPVCNDWHWTPNGITTLSLAAGLIAVECLRMRSVSLFAFFYGLSYFFDCLDGYYARRYNQVTTFGDYYDHVKDVAISAYVLYITFSHIRHTGASALGPALVLGILFGLMYVQLGCQQKVATEKQGRQEVLDTASAMCGDSSWTSWSKFFSPGMFVLSVIIVNFLY